jgi:hypothetical protein
MNSIGIAGDYQGLEGVYIDRTIAMVNNDLGKKAMVWQEVFDNGGAEMDAETVVHVWKVDIDYYQELAKASITFVVNHTRPRYEPLLVVGSNTSSTPWYSLG